MATLTKPALPSLPPSSPPGPPPRPVKPYRSWATLGLVLAGAVVASYLYHSRKPLPAPPEVSKIREETIQPNAIKPTLRLTGVTQARNFYSLLAPELRGSRSGRNRAATASSSSASSSSTSTALGGAAIAASGSTVRSASTSTSSSSVSSSAPSASSAFQNATSRFNTTLRGSAPTSASSKTTANGSTAASPTLGASGLGSTGDSLPGGSQGPPAVGSGTATTGNSEWQLVLQDVVQPGSRVEKDQVVAAFDRQFMLVRLDDYRASVVESDAAQNTQKADLETTRQAHEQMINSAKGVLEKARLDMKTIPVLSAIDAERTRLAFDEAQARYQQLLQETSFLKAAEDAEVRNAELDLTEAKLELKRAEANAEKMIIRAPVSGLAVMEMTWRGDGFVKIQKGDQVWAGEPFMKIVDTSSMVVSATVNQADVDALRIGHKAKVNFDAYPDLELNAYIESIGAMTLEPGQRENFVRQVPVRFRVENRNKYGKPDPRVIPDLTVSVDVELSTPKTFDKVAPAGAIHVYPDGRSYVYVRDSGKWIEKLVEVGERDYVSAAIISGVKKGDVVALDPPNAAEN